jgi:hypothetical protein
MRCFFKFPLSLFSCTQLRFKTGNVLKIDRRLLICKPCRPFIDGNAVVQTMLRAQASSRPCEAPLHSSAESPEINKAMTYLEQCGEPPADHPGQEVVMSRKVVLCFCTQKSSGTFFFSEFAHTNMFWK